MERFDTLLYGNGLTIAVLSIIKEISDSNISKYLNCNNFISEFAFAESHKRIVRMFNKYFKINGDTQREREKARDALRSNANEINHLGFERWVSRNLFNGRTDLVDIKTYAYILYNYWFHLINEEILKKPKIQNSLFRISSRILDLLNINYAIYTTNFDNLLDQILKPQHIHGIFQLPLEIVGDIILKYYNKIEFEYTYLFGTNGLEKLSRLHRIRNIKQNSYELDFFYDDSMILGNLLIYGIAFGKAEFISEDFIKEFPQHKKNKLIKTVDGHILLRLLSRYQNNQLKNITIAYYSESDKKNYEELLGNTQLEKIVEYRKCSEILDWKDAL